MRHFALFAFPLLLLAACTSRPTSESTTAPGDSISRVAASDSGATQTPIPPTSARISSLSLSPDFDWKRVKLGDALTAAKAPETDRPFEEDASHVGYSVEFDNLESVDYQYFTESGKVTGIRVDLYLNNMASVRSYQQDLLAYYNARYGTAKPSANVYAWNKGSVTLKDVSKAKEYGLVLKIGNVPAK
jgi:hypothetical protein